MGSALEPKVECHVRIGGEVYSLGFTLAECEKPSDARVFFDKAMPVLARAAGLVLVEHGAMAEKQRRHHD